MARFAIFRELSDAEEAAVLALARRREFRRNEPLFHEGDPGDTVHLIDKGHVAVRVTTPLGDIATVRVIGRGGLVGEMAVLDATPRSATVVALDPVETLSMHRDVVAQARRDHPTLDRALLAAALNEVRRLSGALTEALYVPTPKRLARHLLALATLFGGDIPLTQDDLAGLSGSTRQTVNQLLGDLQKVGAIAVSRGKVAVLDRTLLERAAR